MENIIFYIGLAVVVLSFFVGIVFICAFFIAKAGDRFPHFIGYKSLMKMDDERFERWIETLKYMRKKKITKYTKEGLKC